MIRDIAYLRSRSVELPFSGCWAWMGAVSRDGYSQIYGPPWSGHKLAVLQTHGAVPDGLEVHHRCGVRCCVNPDHLAVVTRAANVAAMNYDKRRHRNGRKTHCLRGHEFNEENTLNERGASGPARKCRECKNARRRKGNNND